MRNRYLYITLLSVLGFHTETYAQAIAQAPRLVVSITIDQLRTDYLETYAPLYGEEGLRKLLTEGKVFTNGAYNFTPVDRASAIASLYTGTVPYYHGITAYEWLDKETLRPQNCVRDQKIGYSPQFLGTSTLSDELKMATNGVAKVFASYSRCCHLVGRSCCRLCRMDRQREMAYDDLLPSAESVDQRLLPSLSTRCRCKQERDGYRIELHRTGWHW